MLGLISLHERLTRLLGPPGTARHLPHQLKGALGRAQV